MALLDREYTATGNYTLDLIKWCFQPSSP